MWDDFGQFFSVGADVLNAAVDPTTKVVKLQVGDSTIQQVESEGAEMWGPPGLISIPAPPTPGAPSCQTIMVRRGDKDIVIALRDVRAAAIYGNLVAGETALFATSGQARILLKKDGSINLYTTVTNAAGGTGMTISITPSSDTITMLNSKGYGIIIDDTGVAITAGGANSGLKLGSDGSIKLIGTRQTQVDGSSIVLGSIALPVTNAVLVGATGMTGVASTKVLASIM